MPSILSLADIANYHNDVQAGLKLFYSTRSPNYSSRFAAYLISEIDSELKERLSETEMRSSLIILARVEAALNIDYQARCRMNKSDNISIAFRKIHKKLKQEKRPKIRPRLDEEILDTWAKNIEVESRNFISSLRGMLKFRHWLAHGRYYYIESNKYSYQDVYLLANAILNELPLLS